MGHLKYPALLLVTFTIMLLTACTSYYPYAIAIDNDAEVAAIARQTSSAGGFTQKLFDGNYYLSKVEKKNGITVINADVTSVQFGRTVEAYRGYCAEKGGKTVKRYIPAGLPPVLEEGFAGQPVFYRQSPMGRTEFEWCIRDDKPLFALAFTGQRGQPASGLYVLEQKDMFDYLSGQTKAVLEMAKEAENIVAVFRAESIQGGGPVSAGQVELLLYPSQPQIKALFTNNTNDEQQVPVDVPVGLMIGDERYLLPPLLRADFTLQASTSGDNCTWGKSRNVLIIAAGIGISCPVTISYVQDPEYKQIPVSNGALFFAGRSFAVEPVSEIDTKDGKIWLKPRLDDQGR